MPVPAGRSRTTTVRPLTVTDGEPAALDASSTPFGRLRRAELEDGPLAAGLHDPQAAEALAGLQRAAAGERAGSGNATLLSAVRLSTRRRRPVPTFVRHWPAV